MIILFCRCHFCKGNYTASFIGLFLSNIGIMGPMVIIPLYFQTFKHYTPIEPLALIPQGIECLLQDHTWEINRSVWSEMGGFNKCYNLDVWINTFIIYYRSY